jgi:hypothetical protein
MALLSGLLSLVVSAGTAVRRAERSREPLA